MRILFFGHDGRMQVAAQLARDGGHTALPVPDAAALLALPLCSPVLYALPIPVTRDGEHITGTDIPLSSLTPRAGDRLFGGGIPEALRARFVGCSIIDALQDECFNQINARLTAEGGLSAALLATGRGLCGLGATVFGFGRIGKCTAHLLRGFTQSVTVVARRRETVAEARALGYTARLWRAPLHATGEVVFGTVPAPAYEGVTVDEGAVCIDLGGGMPPILPPTDGEVEVTAARGVPGIFAPRAAADAVYACLERLTLEETI